jgi:hypothetical protein
MELAIKSNEICRADDIRPLSDIEIDGVSGGGHLLIGALILAGALYLADRYGEAPWH